MLSLMIDEKLSGMAAHRQGHVTLCMGCCVVVGASTGGKTHPFISRTRAWPML